MLKDLKEAEIKEGQEAIKKKISDLKSAQETDLQKSDKVKKATVEEIIDLGMKQSAGQVQLATCGEAHLDGELDDVAKDHLLDLTVSEGNMLRQPRAEVLEHRVVLDKRLAQ